MTMWWFVCAIYAPVATHVAAARDAMDACVEQSERRRFYLDQQCSRWKRLHQSCILSGIADCDQQLSKLHSCILEADARRDSTPSRTPPPAYGITQPP